MDARMKHVESVQALQSVVAPRRAVGWFIRRHVWCLGYWQDEQRVELARGNGTTARGCERVFRDAIRAYRKGAGR
jgi:hypothetical protein